MHADLTALMDDMQGSGIKIIFPEIGTRGTVLK